MYFRKLVTFTGFLFVKGCYSNTCRFESSKKEQNRSFGGQQLIYQTFMVAKAGHKNNFKIQAQCNGFLLVLELSRIVWLSDLKMPMVQTRPDFKRCDSLDSRKVNVSEKVEKLFSFRDNRYRLRGYPGRF